MSKLNIVPQVVFAPFKAALGACWDKVCNDTKAFLGRLEKDITTKSGDWKVTNTGKLRSKDGNEVQMPLNNPISVLVRFGMQLTDIAKNGGFAGQYKLNEDRTEVLHIGIEAGIPSECQAWIDQMRKDVKQGVVASTPAAQVGK